MVSLAKSFVSIEPWEIVWPLTEGIYNSALHSLFIQLKLLNNLKIIRGEPRYTSMPPFWVFCRKEWDGLILTVSIRSFSFTWSTPVGDCIDSPSQYDDCRHPYNDLYLTLLMTGFGDNQSARRKAFCLHRSGRGLQPRVCVGLGDTRLWSGEVHQSC